MKNTKTKALSLLLALSLVFVAAGCSESESEIEESVVEGNTELSLGAAEDYDYSGFDLGLGLTEEGFWDGLVALDCVILPEDFNAIPVPADEVTPTDDEIEAEVTTIVESYASYVEVDARAAELYDTVSIDYSGSVDGVLFSGGTSTGYSLTLGSGTFIDGFEDQIVGHEPGETFDVVVTFPDGYGESTDADGNAITLSNAEAVFSVTLNSIMEYTTPELTDEWVVATFGSIVDLESVEDFYAILTSEIQDGYVEAYTMDYLMNNSTFIDIPQSIFDYQVCQFLNYYEEEAYYYYGIDLETYVIEGFGYESVDAFLATQEESLIYYTKLSIIQQAVAESLGIAVTDEELSYYAAYADYYPSSYIAMNALLTLVNETIVANAVIS